jgi:hypothetical protein
MKDYKNAPCIEGDYFTCPDTIPSIVEKEVKEPSEIISQKLPLSTDDYQKSSVTKRSYTLYEK